MKIETGEFDSEYYCSQRAGNRYHGYYTRHNVDVGNAIFVDDVVLSAVYQTAMSYEFGDYNCPCPDLELSAAGGADPVLCLLDGLDEEDIEICIEEITELCPIIDTVEKAIELHRVLRKNQPKVKDFVPSWAWDDEDDEEEEE